MKKKPGDLDILGGDHSLLSVGVSIWSLACMWSNTTSLNAKKKQVTRPLKGVVEYTTIKNTSLDEEGCDVVTLVATLWESQKQMKLFPPVNRDIESLLTGNVRFLR
jgi:hypothetical protein